MTQQQLEANFSTLIFSIASSATMAMGLVENPVTNKAEVDLNMARFNIDLLILLQSKTAGNLDAEEDRFLKAVVSDLQMKFLAAQKSN